MPRNNSLLTVHGKPFLLLFFIMALQLAGCSGGGGGDGDGEGDTTAPVTTATPPGGYYATPQSVTLAANEAATIYYTLDGSQPSVGGATTQSGPSPVSNIAIGTGLTTLRFFAVDGQGNTEAVKTESYAVAAVDGTWVGTYQSELFAERALSMALTQTGSSVSGSYTDMAGGYGTISGTVSGSSFNFMAVSSDPDCAGTFTGSGSIVNTTLTFTFTGTDCLGTHNNGAGSVTLQVGTVLAYGQQRPSQLLLNGSALYWQDLGEEPLKKMPSTGGTQTSLTHNLGVPVSMNIQGSDMYWIDYRPGGDTSCIPGETQVLMRSALDGTSNEKLATGEHCAHERASLVVDSANAYWVVSTASPNSYAIEQIPLGGSGGSVVTTTSQPIDTMVRDDTYLYWVEGRYPASGVIKRMPLAGGDISTVYTVTNGISGNLVSQGSDLFVAEILYPYPDNYRILKIPAAGGAATALATVARDSQPVKLAVDATTLYWYDGTGVYSLPIGGGSESQLATISGSGADIAVDGSGVLWLELNGGIGALYEVPLGGGSKSTLASDLFMPYGGALAISGSRVFVTEGDYNITWYGRIAELPRAGGTLSPFFTGITASGQPMVTDGTNVYVVDGWRIVSIPAGGGHAETLVTTGDRIEDLATDGTYIYWLEGGAIRKINRMLAGGGAVETLVTTSEFVEAITLDSTSVFWVEGISTLKKVPLAGGTITTVATVGNVSDLISDGSHVYYSVTGSNTIQRVSVNGGAAETLTSEAVPFLLWRTLAVDAANVYWLDAVTLGKVVKTGGDANFIIPGGMQQDASEPGSAVVDTTHIYWTETTGGTVKRTAK